MRLQTATYECMCCLMTCGSWNVNERWIGLRDPDPGIDLKVLQPTSAIRIIHQTSDIQEYDRNSTQYFHYTVE